MIRNDLQEMIALAERLGAVGEPAVLATLFAVNGSSYRPLGSSMLAGPSAALSAGGISGGCLEDYIVHRGRFLTADKPAVMLSFQMGPDADGDVPSLGCGGSIDVLLERFTLEHLGFLCELAKAYEADHASVVLCTADSSDSSCIAVERAVLPRGELAKNMDPQLNAPVGRAMFAECSMHAAIGPNRRALVQYIASQVRLVILGAGNDAQPLSKLGRSLGWHVTVADHRARLATSSRFPEADQVVAADWWTALESITFTPRTAVVLMTHSLEDDVQILSQFRERSVAYLGVLGPEHRRAWLLDRIDDAEVSAWLRENLRGPIGLDLGDRSPAGIAVSIVAEIQSKLSGRTPVPLSFPAGLDVLDRHATEVVADDRESVSRLL
jgi:xanthine/CO dehydrogenase XdhC/CoxF family maturation factor